MSLREMFHISQGWNNKYNMFEALEYVVSKLT